MITYMYHLDITEFEPAGALEHFKSERSNDVSLLGNQPGSLGGLRSWWWVHLIPACFGNLKDDLCW